VARENNDQRGGGKQRNKTQYLDLTKTRCVMPEEQKERQDIYQRKESTGKRWGEKIRTSKILFLHLRGGRG